MRALVLTQAGTFFRLETALGRLTADASATSVAAAAFSCSLPVFGTSGLQLLLDIHRFAGLAVVAATVVHLYAALLPRFGLS